MTVTIPAGIELTPEEVRQIEFLHSKIGTKLDDPNPLNAYHGQTPFFREANIDAIFHYAWGIDDLNPMWTDPEYARKTPAGTIVAPPSFLFPAAPGGMSGSQFFALGAIFGEHETWGGADLKWHEWIRLGTRITTETHLKDVVVKRSRLSGMLLQLIGHTRFLDEEGKLLAESDSWIFRKRKYQYGTEVSTIKLQEWSREEVDELRARKASENLRGAEPRFWDDVREGDSFSLLKGPYSMMSNYCYLSLWHPTHMWRGDVPWSDLDTRPPGPLGFPDVRNPHYDTTDAKTKGLPGAFDYGPQRHSWSSQLFTNWMGDGGFLESLSFRVKGFNFIGDLQTFTGTVTGKRREEDRYLVECSIAACNQRGEDTGDGSAVVRLPSRHVGS
jgi:acyl dehydratase